MLQNAPTLAIVAVHSAENEPPKVRKSKTNPRIEISILPPPPFSASAPSATPRSSPLPLYSSRVCYGPSLGASCPSLASGASPPLAARGAWKAAPPPGKGPAYVGANSIRHLISLFLSPGHPFFDLKLWTVCSIDI